MQAAQAGAADAEADRDGDEGGDEHPPERPLRQRGEQDVLREILVARRDKIGMTQIDLAAALRGPQSLVSRTEQGERRLDVIEFVEWCDALGCQASAILAELGRREPPPTPTKRDGRRKLPTPS